MPSEQGKTTHEFHGKKALERAKGVLQSYDLNGQINRIYVEIEATYPEEKESLERPNSESQSKNLLPKERSFKQIRTDTNHHKALFALSQMSDEELPASASEISGKVEDVPDTSTFASLSKLHERKLVDRKWVTDVDNPHYVYTISQYGEDELTRLGTPSA